MHQTKAAETVSDRSYREKHGEMHRNLLRRAARNVPKQRRRDGWVSITDLVSEYGKLPIEAPHHHLTHRSIYSYCKAIEKEGLAKTAVVSWGRHTRDAPMGRTLAGRFLDSED